MLEPGGLPAHRVHQGREVPLHDDRDGLRVVELVGDLALPVRRVHRGRDGAEARQREEADQVLGAIGHEEGHAVTARDAEATERAGEGVHASLELPEGEARVVEHDGLALGVNERRTGEHLAVEHGRVRERRTEELGPRGHVNDISGPGEVVKCRSFPEGPAPVARGPV